ncbi:MAG: RNA polymerase sigma factor [Gemmatimonadetes bacterium]|nr:RNA polymerase sigma factor [Gemmatimonadota bacterium]
MDYKVEKDEVLVAEAKAAGQRDHRPFQELVARHQGGVLANCRYLTNSADDAQDLAQEVFVKAFFALKGFEGRAQFKTWIQRIKVNHCMNFLRKQKGKYFVDVDDPESQFHKELHIDEKVTQDVDAGWKRKRIRETLEKMPETLRVPLILCDLDGFSYQEAADQLDIGLSALKMRVKRAREQFREKYGDRES